MTVSVNGTQYEVKSWNGNGFTMETDMNLETAERLFKPGKNVNLIVKEGQDEVARYINKGISSLMIEGTEPRVLTVTFNLTQIEENAETAIRASMEDSDSAIEELGAIVAELSELDAEYILSTLKSHQETLDTWFATAGQILTFIETLQAEGGILDSFDTRISALEAAMKIISIDKN